jgi:hypothetical protein
MRRWGRVACDPAWNPRMRGFLLTVHRQAKRRMRRLGRVSAFSASK